MHNSIEFSKLTDRSYIVINGYKYGLERIAAGTNTLIYTHTEAKNNKSVIETVYIGNSSSTSHVYEVTTSANGTTISDDSSDSPSGATVIFCYE